MTVAFGFDGVLMAAGGTRHGPPTGAPVEGMLGLCRSLSDEGWDVVVCTGRALGNKGRDEVIHWLVRHGFIAYITSVSASIQEADVLVFEDTMCIPFGGHDVAALGGEIRKRKEDRDDG